MRVRAVGDVGGAQGLGEHDEGQFLAHDAEEQGDPHRRGQPQERREGAAGLIDVGLKAVIFQQAQDQAADDEDGPGDDDEFLQAVPGLAGHVVPGGQAVLRESP